ncbi:MarR family winged helix-turn-helix transcriptional regulator [Parapusillimonas granuli]|uniref:MarR family transcriptional regulator n=1 Tax=Parapusillimonas granuli TaxID=380911 RepID=A0A853FZF8_9BURK|nr:MarR family transcriptional regulator [Parapusillimonas granuli]MBB5215340.1 DNA-binding MarR family transcriptional regulator [Parapusillimonas granuli]MEB2400180.1 MarR family transcriptional regulator [Alcaligenaceae bacterium]NYT49993.1 MarR family transcriptional regulator [Parapusillimonas granuli]
MTRNARPSQVEPLQLDTLPGHLIRRLHQITAGIYTQEVGEKSVTQVQFAALQALRNHPGVDQRTLAKLIALDASTTGGVIDRLEARGLVDRRLSPNDRRVKLLYITHEGEALLDRLVPLMLRAQERMLEPLAPEQRAQFMEMLAVLVSVNNELSRAPGME